MSLASSATRSLTSLVQRRGAALLSQSRSLRAAAAQHKVGRDAGRRAGLCVVAPAAGGTGGRQAGGGSTASLCCLSASSSSCHITPTVPQPAPASRPSAAQQAGRPSRLQVAAMATQAAAVAVDERLVAIRQAMAAADGGKGVQAFIVPSEDPHMVWRKRWRLWRRLGGKLCLCSAWVGGVGGWEFSSRQKSLCCNQPLSPADLLTPMPSFVTERVPSRLRRPPRFHLWL